MTEDSGEKMDDEMANFLAEIDTVEQEPQADPDALTPIETAKAMLSAYANESSSSDQDGSPKASEEPEDAIESSTEQAVDANDAQEENATGIHYYKIQVLSGKQNLI